MHTHLRAEPGRVARFNSVCHACTPQVEAFGKHSMLRELANLVLIMVRRGELEGGRGGEQGGSRAGATTSLRQARALLPLLPTPARHLKHPARPPPPYPPCLRATAMPLIPWRQAARRC